jgi:predicted signal transduction protein with EAL and GGDEF domain
VLLKQVAQRTQQALRDTDTVARLGGDEFAVLLQRLTDDKAAEATARKLLSVLALPFHVANHELFVTASIGVACYPSDGKSVEELLRNADAAMYRAKSEGRNSARVFASELNERAYEALTLTNALRHAIDRGEFALHYQLRYELGTGRVSGVEALARWTHPTMGAVPPAKFIPIAENSGLIGEVGLWVLRTACRQMKAWRGAGIDIARMAVNLADDVGIVRAIVAFARTLKLRTIAEGVETAEQRGFLRDCGCDEAQGYLFSKPMPPQELERIIRDEVGGHSGLVLVAR